MIRRYRLVLGALAIVVALCIAAFNYIGAHKPHLVRRFFQSRQPASRPSLAHLSPEEAFPRLQDGYVRPRKVPLDTATYKVIVQGDSEPIMHSLMVQNIGAETVHHFWLWMEGRPNYHNMDTLLDWIIEPEMTSEENVLAILGHFREHMAHFCPPGGREGYDPIKAFAVYGYGICHTVQNAAGAMLEEVGLRTRSVSLLNHHVNEVFYRRKWHLVDFDRSIIIRNDEGDIASYDDILANRHLLQSTEEARTLVPHFFGAEKPSGPGHERSYLSRRTRSNMIAATGEAIDVPAKGVEHVMEFTLRPAETVELRWKAGDKYFARLRPDEPVTRKVRKAAFQWNNPLAP